MRSQSPRSKMRIQSYLPVAFFIITLALAFTNCGQPGDLAFKKGNPQTAQALATPPTTSSDPLPPSTPLTSPPLVPPTTPPVTTMPPTPPPPPKPEQILLNCAQAQAQGKLLAISQNIVFEDSRVESRKNNICPFSSSSINATDDGNLSMLDTQLRARYEQVQKLNVPENAVLCAIEMKNDLQTFKYDDVFFLTFNDYILATNDKTALSRLVPEVSPLTGSTTSSSIELYKYDWISLRTAPFKNVADDYCVGQKQGLGECQWPITEQLGKIQFTWDPEILIRMSAKNSAQNQSFRFVITGDDNPAVDCYHERLSFDTKVYYYLPKPAGTL